MEIKACLFGMPSVITQRTKFPRHCETSNNCSVASRSQKYSKIRLRKKYFSFMSTPDSVFREWLYSNLKLSNVVLENDKHTNLYDLTVTTIFLTLFRRDIKMHFTDQSILLCLDSYCRQPYNNCRVYEIIFALKATHF